MRVSRFLPWLLPSGDDRLAVSDGFLSHLQRQSPSDRGFTTRCYFGGSFPSSIARAVSEADPIPKSFLDSACSWQRPFPRRCRFAPAASSAPGSAVASDASTASCSICAHSRVVLAERVQHAVRPLDTHEVHQGAVHARPSRRNDVLRPTRDLPRR